MELSTVIILLGAASLIVCLSFLLVCLSRKKLNATTTGVVTGMCRDAAAFHASVKENEHPPLSENTQGNFYSRAAVGTNDRRLDPTVTYYLTYSYEVNGVTYHRASNISMNAGMAKKKIGQQRVVHYNTENPFQSTILTGTIYKVLSSILIPIGLVCVIIGIALWRN